MPGSQLRFEHSYDLAREIVWDALVDPDLVSGWLAEADIEPRLHGRYDLDWSHFTLVRATTGEIIELDETVTLSETAASSASSSCTSCSCCASTSCCSAVVNL